jgi:hypothetical protein
MTYPIDEVEAAFRSYWQAGAVNEDWDAWCDVFTDDARYVEHFFGEMVGRETIREWITPIMLDQFPEMYTVYEWHLAGPDGRVVVYMQNRRDHPNGTDVLDFPGVTILEYAGDGKFSFEEDFWALGPAQKTSAAYAHACAESDPQYAARRTRNNWGSGPEWTRGRATYFDRVGAAKRAERT